jgi:hypothetical protein
MDAQQIIRMIVTWTYYIIVGVIAVLSLFGVYLLAAHGRSRILSLIVSLVYIAMFLAMLGTSEATLHTLL